MEVTLNTISMGSTWLWQQRFPLFPYFLFFPFILFSFNSFFPYFSFCFPFFPCPFTPFTPDFPVFSVVPQYLRSVVAVEHFNRSLQSANGLGGAITMIPMCRVSVEGWKMLGGHGAGRGKIAHGLKPQSKVIWKHDDINAHCGFRRFDLRDCTGHSHNQRSRSHCCFRLM